MKSSCCPEPVSIGAYLPVHFERVSELLLRSFRVDEPMCKHLKISIDESQEVFESFAKASLEGDNVSFVAQCVNNEKVVGCRLSSIKEPDGKALMEFPTKQHSQSIQIITDIVKQLSDNFYMLLPDTVKGKKLLKFDILTVDKDFRRRGLARKMVEASISKGLEYNCYGVIVIASSYKTQAMFKSMNFQTLRSIDYKEYVDPVSGQRPLTGIPEPDEAIKLMIKYL